jgi:hypothetical protein
MKTARTPVISIALLFFSLSAFAKAITITQPHGGVYYITLSKDALLPSPNDQYYIEIVTGNRLYVGKSKLFYWK